MTETKKVLVELSEREKAEKKQPTAPPTVLDKDDKIRIDGDKLLAFINAIQYAGKMMELINVIEIKDAFIVGKQIASIEKVLEYKQKWNECWNAMHKMMGEELKIWDKGMREGREMIVILQQFRAFGHNPQYTDSFNKLKEIVELCDRLQKHRESGILSILQSLLDHGRP
jgi:hypothetical protein